MSYRRRTPARRPYRRRITGSGAYRIGRAYVRGRGAYRVPRRRYTRGRGAYKIPGFNAKKLGMSLGASGGAALGNYLAPGIGGEIGSSLGSMIGQGAGSLFKKLTGFGDYQVKSNALLGLGADAHLPSFGPDTIVVQKREYITDITASFDFSNNSFPVNPGLSEVFPWLSSISQNYEMYRFLGLIFEYVSTSAVSLTTEDNISLGTVCLSSDYNSADPAYVNMPQMLSTMFSNSGRPSDSIQHAVECAPGDQAQKWYYVRSGDVPSGTDIRLYDMLSHQVGVQGLPVGTAGQNIGQLWVNYSVMFSKSVQNNQLGFDINSDKYILVAPSQAAAYFGTSRTLEEGSNLGTTVTTTEIRFPPTLQSGYYQITYQAIGNSTAVSAPTFNGGSTCEEVAAQFNNETQGGISNSGNTSVRFFYTAIWKILTRDATITVSGGTLPAVGTFGDLLITQFNGELIIEENED